MIMMKVSWLKFDNAHFYSFIFVKVQIQNMKKDIIKIP